MKKLIIIIGILIMPSLTYAEEKKVNCESKLAKLKPSCNFIGTGVKGLKKFSSKHKTIGETLGMDPKDKKEPQTLKEFSKNHKTVGQTLKGLKDKK